MDIREVAAARISDKYVEAGDGTKEFPAWLIPILVDVGIQVVSKCLERNKPKSVIRSARRGSFLTRMFVRRALRRAGHDIDVSRATAALLRSGAESSEDEIRQLVRWSRHDRE